VKQSQSRNRGTTYILGGAYSNQAAGGIKQINVPFMKNLLKSRRRMLQKVQTSERNGEAVWDEDELFSDSDTQKGVAEKGPFAQ